MLDAVPDGFGERPAVGTYDVFGGDIVRAILYLIPRRRAHGAYYAHVYGFLAPVRIAQNFGYARISSAAELGCDGVFGGFGDVDNDCPVL